MITINLLPDEYRRKAGSPIGVIAAIAAAALVNASLLSLIHISEPTRPY